MGGLPGGVEMQRIWTYELAMAAAKDEADRAMRREGRVKWNVDDWNLMCETFDRLYLGDMRLYMKAKVIDATP
jgi:hypothetical protein